MDDEPVAVECDDVSEHNFEEQEEPFEENETEQNEDEEMSKEEYFKPEERFHPANGMRPMRPMRHAPPMQYRSGPGPRAPFPPGFRGPRMPMHMSGPPHGVPFMRHGMGPNRNGPQFDGYGPPMGMPRGPPRHPQQYPPRYPPMSDEMKEDMDDSVPPYGDINGPNSEFDSPNPNAYQNMQPHMRPRGPPPPYMMGPHGPSHQTGPPHGPPPFGGPPGSSFNGPPYGSGAPGPHYNAAGPAFGGPVAGRPFGGPPGPPFPGSPSNQGPTSVGQNFGGSGSNGPPNTQDFTPGSGYGAPPWSGAGSNYSGPIRPPFNSSGSMGPPPPMPPSGPPAVPPPGTSAMSTGVSSGVPPGTPPVSTTTSQAAPVPPVAPPNVPSFGMPETSTAPGYPPGAPLFGSPRPPFNTSGTPTQVSSAMPVTSTTPGAPPMCPTPIHQGPPIPSGFAFPEGSPFGMPPGFPAPPGGLTRPMAPLAPGTPAVPLHMMPPPMPAMPVMSGSMPPFRPPMPFVPPTMPIGSASSVAQPSITRATGDDIWVENLTAEGKSYYYSMRTRETRWDRPEGVTIVRQGEVEGSSKPPVTASVLPVVPSVLPGNMTTKPPDVAIWTEYHNPEGKAYYHNSKTGETTWEKPKVLSEWEDKQKMTSTAVNFGSSAATIQNISASTKPAAQTENKERSKSEPQEKTSANQSGAEVKSVTEAQSGKTNGEKSETPSAKEDTVKTPKDSSRPVSSTAVPGTPWCVVWTGDDRAFFFNPSQRLSVWEKPEELKGRADVDRLLEKQPNSNNPTEERTENTSAPLTNDVGDEESASKKPRLENDETQSQDLSQNTVSSDINEGEGEKPVAAPDKIPVGMEAAREAEERAARERAVQPLEVRVRRFREMLVEMQVSAFSTWEKELHKIVFDPRYLLLASKERKQTFEAYVKERAEEERREKKNKLKERKEKFNELLEEAELTTKSSFSDFAAKFGKDERFKAIEKSRDREAMFQDFLSDLRKREKDEKHREKEKVKSDFLCLLKEVKGLSRHSHWSEIKRKIDSDPRYKAVDSSSRREDWFREYVKKLDENPPSREDSDSRKERERKERQEASIREREKEVKEALSSSLREREKEREQQLHVEQEDNFRALLSEFVRDPGMSWKEAKKVLRKDSRWELVSDVLQRTERDEMFKEHLANLAKKHRDVKASDDKEKRRAPTDLDERSEDVADKKLRSSSKDSGRR